MRGLILATLLLATTLYGEEPTSADPTLPVGDVEIAIETYIPPKAHKLYAPNYPRRPAAKGQEGWVLMNFMVDPKGKPYEIEVMDSVGDDYFRKAALRAVETWRFEPAMLNGEAIDAAARPHRITFELTDLGGGARASFVKHHQRLINAIEEKDQAAAIGWINKIAGVTAARREGSVYRFDRNVRFGVQNLYEDAFLHLALYGYFRVWGSEQDQLWALRRAIGYEKGAKYLPESSFDQALRSIFVLQVRQKQYARALYTWNDLQAQATEKDQLASLERVVQQIYDIRDGAQAFSRNGEIWNSALSGHSLLKKKFSFQDVDGELAELKLYCDKGYVGFRFQQGMQYTVRDDLGNCGLTVIGNPGTTYTLVEF